MHACTISPAFFLDDDLAGCEPTARLLLVGLWCMADEGGFVGASAARIRGEVFPYDTFDILPLLDQLTRAGFLARAERAGRPGLVVRPRGCLSLPRRWVGSDWGRLRAEVFARDAYTCRYCGAHDLPLECDHVLPRSRGGRDEPANLATACRPCNRRKQARTPEEWAR